MQQTYRIVNAFCVTMPLIFSLPVRGYETPPAEASKAAVSSAVSVSALWRDRGDIGSLNLLYGAGGKEHQPAGKFTFVKEDKQGTAPKFEILRRARRPLESQARGRDQV